MSDRYRAILDSLRKGASFADACREGRLTVDAVRAAMADDDDLAEAVEAAEAEGGAALAGKVVTWADLARMSEEREARERAERKPPAILPPVMRYTEDGAPASAGFEDVRAEALSSFPDEHPHFSTLRWIDARCQVAGLHPLSDWWLEHFRSFISSGKMVDAGRVGLRGGKSVSICRALVNDVLFAERKLDPGTVGVCPIMSANRTEATDRFVTIKRILAACGLAPAKGADELEPLAGGVGGEYRSSTLPSGGGVIKLIDSQGHNVEFRIYPAALTAAVGYTAIAGFCDEVDLWRDKVSQANPAERVLELLRHRFTTTEASARLYIFSASYNPTSTHARVIAQGDTEVQHVARLGDVGAALDEEARHRLAATLGIDDPRLTAPSDPASCDIPSWVTSPAAPIETCHKLSRDLAAMLGQFGGRAHEMAPVAKVASPLGLADRVRELNGRINARDAERRLTQFAGLSALDPRSRTPLVGSARTRRRAM